MDESQIIEVWDVFKEYIPEKHKEVAANHYVDFLVGQDVEVAVLEALVGFDPHLDQAIELVLEGVKEETDDDVDWGYGQEDED